MVLEDVLSGPWRATSCLGIVLGVLVVINKCYNLSVEPVLVLLSDISKIHQQRSWGLEIRCCGMRPRLWQTRIKTSSGRHFRTLECEKNRRVLYTRGGQREWEMVDRLSLMFSSWASVVKGQCASRHASGLPRTPWCPSSLTPLLCFYPLIRKASCFSLFIYLSFPQSSSHHTPPNPPPQCSVFFFLFLTLSLLEKHVKNLIPSRR